MATLKEVRSRIGTVRNIAQITRAMEMVAASRMKRAQDAIIATRPYANQIRAVIERVSAAVGTGAEELNPLLARREVRRVGLIVITTDRGLAGALNANAIRSVLRYIRQRESAGGVQVEAITIGRKGRDLLRRLGVPVAAHFGQMGDRPAFSDIGGLARLVIDDYLAGKYDEIGVAFSEFVTTLSQRPVVWPIIPIERPPEGADEGSREYLFEPSPEAVLAELLPHSVAVRIYRTLLENIASEQSARMVAMRNATQNANDLIGDLTLIYNKTRQSNITREMIEIASGAEAMAG